MKIMKYLVILIALGVVLPFSAQANKIKPNPSPLVPTFTLDPSLNYLGAVAFPGGKGGNSPPNNLVALNTFLAGSPNVLGYSLVLNIESPDSGPTNPALLLPITDFAGEYIVVHYGKGSGGSNPGGSWEFFSVNPGFTSDTLPAFGNVGGADSFATGGISSIRVFAPRVPDGGTTVTLFGLALSSLGAMRRYLKR